MLGLPLLYLPVFDIPARPKCIGNERAKRKRGLIEGNNNEIFSLWFLREKKLILQTTVLTEEEE